MKIVQTTPRRLVIEDRPWFLWLLLPVLALPSLYASLTGQIDGVWTTLLVGGLGAGMLWIVHHFAPFQRLTFDRDTGLFTHDLYRITGRARFERPLAEIKCAADEGHYSDGTRLSRVTLLTTDGRHPLESGFSSRNPKPVIQVINAWLTETGDAP